jgi:DNA-binding LytR/AlgR family response regulator
MTFATAWLLSQVQPGRIVTIAGLPSLYAAVASVQLMLAILIGRSSEVELPNPAPAEPRKSRPDFAMRIPLHLGGELIAIECEDHYLRVHTKLGSDLILCRLADALNELGEADGRRVHRSWWVADDAVVGVDKEGGRSFLRLTNGLRVPVSKTYLPSTREWRRVSLPAA